MNPISRRFFATAALAALAATPGLALADDTAPTLKPGQVTENALVNALAIDPGPQALNGQTRSIRPSMKAGAGAAAGPGKANLLITFATDSADLTPESIQALTTVGHALQSDRLAGFTFRIEGHADPRGAPDYNMHLSELRAQSVVAYLVENMGILPDRLNAIGKGSADPLNPSQPAAPENRRVTIITTR